MYPSRRHHHHSPPRRPHPPRHHCRCRLVGWWWSLSSCRRCKWWGGGGRVVNTDGGVNSWGGEALNQLHLPKGVQKHGESGRSSITTQLKGMDPIRNGLYNSDMQLEVSMHGQNHSS